MDSPAPVHKASSKLFEICPMGFANFEQDCPNAPCIECMGRLKDHMLEELGVMERQSKIAKAKEDQPSATLIDRLILAFRG